MLLLYCMTEAGVDSGQLLGVRGAEVLSCESNGLACHFSALEDTDSKTQDDALAFWAVTNGLFQTNSVIPFRYPTFMADENAIQEFLAANTTSYLAELRRIRGLVQMKVTIQTSPASTATAVPTSGTEYLKQRQRASQSALEASDAARKAAADVAYEWKQEQRKDVTILFALIERDMLNEFKSRIAKLGSSGAQVSYSGPWPPSEFVNSGLEVPAFANPAVKNG
jgi:hypothetical protein